MHCHLDLYPNHREMIAECDREEVATLTVTTTPKAWLKNHALAAESKHVRVGLGLHPQLVAERADEIKLFERYLSEARYVGEVGLDAGPDHYRSMGAQERVFERVLRLCAEQGGKVLTIHSVRAVAKVLNHLERSLPGETCVPILHWFTGSIAEARRAADLGCYFSVNSAMLASEKGRKLVVGLPIERILTETDGPFVEIHGRKSRPLDVKNAVAGLAELRGRDLDAMRIQVISNLRALVKKKTPTH
jgi:TatD DNase family protein